MIAPMAFGNPPAAGLASEHRADAQLLYPGRDDSFDLRLFQQRAALDDDFVRGGIAHVLGGGATEDTARPQGPQGAPPSTMSAPCSRPSVVILRPDDSVVRPF